MGPAGFFLPAQGIELLLFRLNLVLLPYQTTGADQQYQTRHGTHQNSRKTTRRRMPHWTDVKKMRKKPFRTRMVLKSIQKRIWIAKGGGPLAPPPFLFYIPTELQSVRSTERPRALSTMPEQSLHSPDTSFPGI